MMSTVRNNTMEQAIKRMWTALLVSFVLSFIPGIYVGLLGLIVMMPVSYLTYRYRSILPWYFIVSLAFTLWWWFVAAAAQLAYIHIQVHIQT